ncbi:hypothetical protein GKE82_25095 [Conexibacter sp. W3-3-2]|uniref:hypothetical protein n=1 Tax=Conexibacter sp. W3-3-2 TaxID=2675227 RepID=UPI0012B76217|nr:hypothetical protein [Conexibacter sp. W3-3-2]MTD47483.1 hypothetical protein [Conexibacter sp. W3-3-2]
MRSSPDIRLIAILGGLALIIGGYAILVPPSERAAARAERHVVGDAEESRVATRRAVLVVRGYRLVGGSKRIRVVEGDRVVLKIDGDRDEVAHLDGYDLSAPIGPGQSGLMRFDATQRGSFALELEGAAEQLAEIQVQARPEPSR